MSDFNYWYSRILKRELGSSDPAKARAEAEFRHCWSAAQSAPHSRVVVRCGLTEEAMQICQEMREDYQPWLAIAKSLGVDESTLRRAWKRSGRTMQYTQMKRIHALYMQRMPWKLIAREVDMNMRTMQERYYKWAKENEQTA